LGICHDGSSPARAERLAPEGGVTADKDWALSDVAQSREIPLATIKRAIMVAPVRTVLIL
jgi:hypothetical protein